MLLLDKIFSQQASGQKSLEAAIVKAIEAQGKIYDKIAERQIKELAEILSNSFKEIKPVYVPVVTEVAKETSASNNKEIYFSPSQSDTPSEDLQKERKIDEGLKNEEKNDKNSQILYENDEQLPPVKKKKKKKKKKKDNEYQEFTEDQKNNRTKEQVFAEEINTDEPDVLADISQAESFSIDDFPSIKEDIVESMDTSYNEADEDQKAEHEDKVSTAEWNIPSESDVSSEINSEPVNYQDWGINTEKQETISATQTRKNIWQDDDEGWGYNEKEAAPGNENDQKPELNWNVEDEGQEDAYVMTAIGENSYIGSSDLSEQPKDENEISPVLSKSIPINIKNMPLIYDNSDENVDSDDPYQNSILKD